MNLVDAIKILKRHNEHLIKHSKWDFNEPITAIDTVIAEVEKPRYSAKDVQSFFSWADNNGWSYGELTELWYNDEEELEGLTIEEVLKIWKEATEL